MFMKQIVFILLGWYLATKKIHFVVVTSWVWVTNLITSLTDAYLNKIPLFLISTNSNTKYYWLWNHHDSSTLDDWIDTVWLTKYCTCFSVLGSHPNSIAKLFFKAYNYAIENSMPVHISISKNLFNEEVKFEEYYNVINNSFINNNQDLLLSKSIYEILNSSNYPLIITSNKVDEKLFSKFIMKNNIIFLNTLNNVSLNYEYVKNNTYNKIIKKLDLVIFLWNKLDKYLIDNDFKSLNYKYIIHVSDNILDQSYLFWKKYFFIKTDINSFISTVSNNLNKKYYDINFVTKYKSLVKASYHNDYKNNIFYNFINKVNLLIPFWSSIFIDVGSVLNYSSLFLSPISKSYVNFPSSFFNMGSSYKSIWYSFYNKNPNLIFIWDGSFYMNMWEIITAVENDLNLTFVILNNNWYSSPLFMKYWVDLSDNKFCKYSKWLDYADFSKSIKVDYFLIDDCMKIDEVFEQIIIKQWVKILEIKALFSDKMPI